MFYDENGKHVRTKKEILDEAGQLRSGCKVIPKGEVYERNLFTIKDSWYKSESFLDEVKRSYTDLINIYVKDDKQKLKVFDRNGVYIYNKLEKQNAAIYDREQQLASVEKELVGAKGIFKAKQRKELQEQAEQIKTLIGNMKQYLSSIVQGYGYKNVKEFLAEYKASKAEYTDYQSAVAKWEQQTGNKAESDSMKARLQRKQQEVQERENSRQSHQHKKDRGAR